LLRLTVARRKNLLRYWLRTHACRLPQRRLHTLDAQLFSADDSQPVIDLEDGRLHRSSGRLWLLRGADMTPAAGQPIEAQGETILCSDNGVLSVHLSGMAQAGLQDWSVAYRRGGEQIKLPGRPAQSLKNLFQEADIPTWLRPKIPLVYHAGTLVSVGGRWNASDYLLSTAGSGWHIRWQLRSRCGDQGAGNTGTLESDCS
jgi:tRNA(Ile)-lysidine synthase